MTEQFAVIIGRCHGKRQSVRLQVESVEQTLGNFYHRHQLSLRPESVLAYSWSGKTTNLELLAHDSKFKDHYIGARATRSTCTLCEFKRYDISLSRI
jgi:hypothetical protein